MISIHVEIIKYILFYRKPLCRFILYGRMSVLNDRSFTAV